MSAANVTPGVRRRILIADDEPIFRDGVRIWLSPEPDLACCGEAASVAEVRRAVEQEKPDLLLLELHLKGEDGFSLIKSLVTHQPALRILVVSRHDEMVFGHRALRAGARGYFMKQQDGPALLQAIRAVLSGEIHASKQLAATMIRKLWHGDTSGDRTGRLSDRELQVFRMLGSGVGTKQVARRLRLSVKTVETYREHIKRKLDLENAPSLVHAATTWVQSQSASLAEPQASDQA
jgi:DNA-binding NarL/FixJ family response regulator